MALVEVLVAVLILGFVVATSLWIFFDRQKRLKLAADTITAYQAIASEAEVVRTVPYEELRTRNKFYSVIGTDGTVQLGALSALKNVTTNVEVTEPTPVVKQIKLTVEWEGNNAPRSATMSIFRTPAAD
jgi:cytoskeletal protein RodZ